MRKFVLVLLASLSLMLGLVGSAMAAPSAEHYPSNPNACVGYSSTSANFVYQGEDPDKYRSDQAHGDYPTEGAGEQGRKDDIRWIWSVSDCDRGLAE